jgi:hypothetical protein
LQSRPAPCRAHIPVPAQTISAALPRISTSTLQSQQKRASQRTLSAGNIHPASANRLSSWGERYNLNGPRRASIKKGHPQIQPNSNPRGPPSEAILTRPAEFLEIKNCAAEVCRRSLSSSLYFSSWHASGVQLSFPPLQVAFTSIARAWFRPKSPARRLQGDRTHRSGGRLFATGRRARIAQ